MELEDSGCEVFRCLCLESAIKLDIHTSYSSLMFTRCQGFEQPRFVTKQRIRINAQKPCDIQILGLLMYNAIQTWIVSQVIASPICGFSIKG